jgi:hypothetical protein
MYMKLYFPEQRFIFHEMLIFCNKYFYGTNFQKYLCPSMAFCDWKAVCFDAFQTFEFLGVKNHYNSHFEDSVFISATHELKMFFR